VTTLTENKIKSLRIYTSIKLVIRAGPLVHKISYLVVIATPTFPQNSYLFTFLNIFYLARRLGRVSRGGEESLRLWLSG